MDYKEIDRMILSAIYTFTKKVKKMWENLKYLFTEEYAYNAPTKNNTPQENSEKVNEEDLEDGEIEDDEEENTSALPPEVPPVESVAAVVKPDAPIPIPIPIASPESNSEKEKKRDRGERPEKRRHEDKGKKHMTEAERSILHLRKREEMQRKKWEKMRSKEALVESIDDDFAKNIEKTLATILNKKEKEAALAAGVSGGEESYKEEKDKETRKSRKRRKHEKDKMNKQRKLDSPKLEIDENDLLNMSGDGEKFENMHSAQSEESIESEYSSDPNKTEEKEKEKEKDKKRKKKNRSGKDKKHKKDKTKDLMPLQDSQGVCVFYLQGKCQKNDCPYSHEAVPPMKLELCKFYLMDCCAKGDKCSYMHSEFPCKFYHTGLKCAQGDDCKFAHGKPLSESLKQILFKHIETAPREILGGFPRMSRDEALNMINVTQTKLQEHEQGVEIKPEVKGGIPSLFDINVPVPPELLQGSDDVKSKTEKGNRNRPSRWQDPDPIVEREFPLKPFTYGQDQDMRINSNGDVDMRTLPPALPSLNTQNVLPNSMLDNQDLDLERYKREAGILQIPKQDMDIRPKNLLAFPSASKDIDIRQQSLLASKDVDIRQIPPTFQPSQMSTSAENDNEDEPMLQIDTGGDKKDEEISRLPADLPKAQRDLFLRIQANQKDNVVETENKEGYEVDENINWYSDDDDDDENRLTIKVDHEDTKDNKEVCNESSSDNNDLIKNPPAIKPQDFVEKLGDLSKIDISAEVTKLLTSMSQSNNQTNLTKPPVSSPEIKPTVVESPKPSDPRLSTRQDPRLNSDKPTNSPRSDPRLSADPRQRPRQGSIEVKSDKVSIYEQGSLHKNVSPSDDDIDLRVTGFKSDLDLRNLQLPFKGMQNYTPATEIDASVNSHPLINWKLEIVDIPRPDYTGLKLNISDAEKTGDPRLRKIFRLSIEERDTPMSPKASPKSTPTVRVDPRLRKVEEPKPDPIAASMNYNQQINLLRSSAFYQSLTSQQKVLLNKELSIRNDTNSNSHDPLLNNLLSNLEIIPGANVPTNPSLKAALSILAGASSKLNSLVNQNPAMLGPLGGPNISQPGLLGAAPGIPNIPNEFSMNFDPRNGGLLGNAPLPFGGFGPPQENQGNFQPYNDDYYPPDNQGHGSGPGGFQGGHRDNRGFNRDRRRGRNNYHGRNNSGNRNFRSNRHNRSNRTHSPP